MVAQVGVDVGSEGWAFCLRVCLTQRTINMFHMARGGLQMREAGRLANTWKWLPD